MYLHFISQIIIAVSITASGVVHHKISATLCKITELHIFTHRYYVGSLAPRIEVTEFFFSITKPRNGLQSSIMHYGGVTQALQSYFFPYRGALRR